MARSAEQLGREADNRDKRHMLLTAPLILAPAPLALLIEIISQAKNGHPAWGAVIFMVGLSLLGEPRIAAFLRRPIWHSGPLAWRTPARDDVFRVAAVAVFLVASAVIVLDPNTTAEIGLSTASTRYLLAALGLWPAFIFRRACLRLLRRLSGPPPEPLLVLSADGIWLPPMRRSGIAQAEWPIPWRDVEDLTVLTYSFWFTNRPPLTKWRLTMLNARGQLFATFDLFPDGCCTHTDIVRAIDHFQPRLLEPVLSAVAEPH